MLNFQANVINMYQLCNNNLVDTGHKLNVDKTFRRRPGRSKRSKRLMYVQFTSSVYGERQKILRIGSFNQSKHRF